MASTWQDTGEIGTQHLANQGSPGTTCSHLDFNHIGRMQHNRNGVPIIVICTTAMFAHTDDRRVLGDSCCSSPPVLAAGRLALPDWTPLR